jgi:hypothetical protein
MRRGEHRVSGEPYLFVAVMPGLLKRGGLSDESGSFGVSAGVGISLISSRGAGGFSSKGGRLVVGVGVSSGEVSQDPLLGQPWDSQPQKQGFFWQVYIRITN